MTGGVIFLDSCKFVGPPSKAQGRMICGLDFVGRAMSRDVVVTCAEEDHPKDDPHTKKKAFDIRVKDLPPAIQLTLYQSIVNAMGGQFTTLYECPEPPGDALLRQIAFINPDASGPHIHLQVKKGQEYPNDAS